MFVKLNKSLEADNELLGKNLCPLCGLRDCYKKFKTVKDGYTVQGKNGNYRFIFKGNKIVKIEWWTCKPCSKMPTKKYLNHLINYYK